MGRGARAGSASAGGGVGVGVGVGGLSPGTAREGGGKGGSCGQRAGLGRQH